MSRAIRLMNEENAEHDHELFAGWDIDDEYDAAIDEPDLNGGGPREDWQPGERARAIGDPGVDSCDICRTCGGNKKLNVHAPGCKALQVVHRHLASPPTDTDKQGARRALGIEPEPEHDDAQRTTTVRFSAGGAFILDAPPQPPVVWGNNETILWAEGEPFLLSAHKASARRPSPRSSSSPASDSSTACSAFRSSTPADASCS